MKFVPGFAFRCLSTDGVSVFVVNVCGHESVEMPLARSMDAVTDEFIDIHGLDNFIVPLAVQEPKKCNSDDVKYVVDVVVHPCVARRCHSTYRMCQEFVHKLTVLAVEWICSEWGVHLDLSSCKLVGLNERMEYKVAADAEAEAHELEEFLTASLNTALEAVEVPRSKLSSNVDSKSDGVENLLVTSTKAKKGSLVREIVLHPGIKRGFLVDYKGRLYGEKGSVEGSGKSPDPLAHIPASLRSRCQVIDTRTMGVRDSQSVASDIVVSAQTRGMEPKENGDGEGDISRGVGGDNIQPMQDVEHAIVSDVSTWKLLSLQCLSDQVSLDFGAPEHVVGMRDVNLAVSDTHVELDGVEFVLPKRVCPEGVRARFIKKSRILHVTCCRLK